MAVTQVEGDTRTTGSPPEGADVVLNTTTPGIAPGVYSLLLDLNALAAGDVLEVRVKEKCLSGSTQRVVFAATLADAQGADGGLWVSPPLMLIHGWDFTLRQTAGSSRSIPWSIRRAG